MILSYVIGLQESFDFLPAAQLKAALQGVLCNAVLKGMIRLNDIHFACHMQHSSDAQTAVCDLRLVPSFPKNPSDVIRVISVPV